MEGVKYGVDPRIGGTHSRAPRAPPAWPGISSPGISRTCRFRSCRVLRNDLSDCRCKRRAFLQERVVPEYGIDFDESTRPVGARGERLHIVEGHQLVFGHRGSAEAQLEFHRAAVCRRRECAGSFGPAGPSPGAIASRTICRFTQRQAVERTCGLSAALKIRMRPTSAA